MSIAFLCLTYHGMNPALKAAKLPNVFMNIKETSPSSLSVVEGNTQHVYTFPTKWGDPSLVDATLSLLKEALKEKHAWFLLISHDSFPLVTYSEMVDYMETETKSMFDLISQDGLVWKTSQWWCLNRADAELIVEHESAFREYLREVPFPKNAAWDELFFLSCLKHANPVYTFTLAKPVYVEWLSGSNSNPGPDQKHPVTFGKRLPTDSFGNSFFVRKTTLAFDNKISLKKKLLIRVYGSSSEDIDIPNDFDVVLISLVSNDRIPESLLNRATRIYFSFYKSVQQTLDLVLKQFPTHLWEAWLQAETGDRTRYEPPKVAFLFLTISDHNQPEIWSKYLEKTDKFSVYAHPKINKIKTMWLKEAVIPKRVKTGWGHITEAYYRLMEEALKDPRNMKFMFLSESCIPLKPFDDFYQKVITEDEGLQTSYVKLMPISGYDRAERIETQKGNESYTFIKHYARMCLSRVDVEKLVANTLKARKMRAFFNAMHVGDEFFLSGIRMEHMESFEITYDNWEDTRKRAKALDEELIELRRRPTSIRTEEMIRRKEAETKVIRNNPKTYTGITGDELDVAINKESFFWRKFVPGPLPWTQEILRLNRTRSVPRAMTRTDAPRSALPLPISAQMRPSPSTRKIKPKETIKNKPKKTRPKTRNVKGLAP
jgi:hypothetical protein